MIEYRLKDIANNTFSLNGAAVPFSLKGAMTQGGDSFSFDNRVVERSFLPGSKLVGESRLEAREITLEMPEMNSDSDTYRDNINSLLAFLRKTVYIEDNTNQMQIKVVPSELEIDYDAGSLKKYSENSFSFECLNPYWEDLAEDSETGTATAVTIEAVAFDNEGYLEAYPVITLVATTATTDVDISLFSDNTGIQIQDSIFGTAGNLTMVIDCGAGLVSINDLNRNVSIVPGAGCFPLPVGADTLNILSNQTITYTIESFKRYFV